VSPVKRQLPQAIAPLATPVSIPPGSIDRIDRYYVVCSRDRAIRPVLQRRMIRDNPCADVVEIDTDHTPQLSRPKELAKALDQFAAHAARSRR
jgi:hypothetical protein